MSDMNGLRFAVVAATEREAAMAADDVRGRGGQVVAVATRPDQLLGVVADEWVDGGGASDSLRRSAALIAAASRSE